MIAERQLVVERSLATRRFGSYTIQAAISAVHAEAKAFTDTDWNQIVSLYALLLRMEPSAVIELNHAVAISMRVGCEAGLRLIKVFSSEVNLPNTLWLIQRMANCSAERVALPRLLPRLERLFL